MSTDHSLNSQMSLDHIGFHVGDFSTSRAFYLDALAPLGIGIFKEGPGWALIGKNGRGQFWIDSFGAKASPLHIAFAATSRAQVRAFYDAAIKAGGKDNGVPGIRAQYHANYYGAFVIDPDGHNIEAVCHAPEPSFHATLFTPQWPEDRLWTGVFGHCPAFSVERRLGAAPMSGACC